MPATERTARRTQRWQQDLDRQYDRDQAQAQARAQAQSQAQTQTASATSPIPQSPGGQPPRAPHTPWGQSVGIDEALGEPDF